MNIWTNSPAMAGPEASAIESVASSLLLALTRYCFGTRIGRKLLSAIWNTAVAEPVIITTPYNRVTSNTPNNAAIGMTDIATPLTKSAMIRILRLLPRSIIPPINNAANSPGRAPRTTRKPTCVVLASSEIMAMIGTTVRVIREPKALPIWAAHNRRKLRFCNSSDRMK